MKLLLYDMGAYTQSDIIDTLRDMQIECRNVLYKLQNIHEDAYFTKRIKELLAAESYDAVFSVNYYPVLAEVCKARNIPYLSWSYDSPIRIEGIENTLGYATNYVFFFDRKECEKYRKLGFGNVYHLPLAVNTKRLDAIRIDAGEHQKYQADVSMVGQLYDNVLPMLMTPLGEYEKGYLTAVLETQLRMYGAYFLDEVLTEEFMEQIHKSYAALGDGAVMLTKDGLLLEMAKYITRSERMLLLGTLSEQYNVSLYGPDMDETLPKSIWHGSAGYFDEMPRVFKASKINLNVSLKCIQSGIPLRALDIIGCGGFLLSNYQPELAEYFVDGEDIVMYTSMEDALQKCAYYIEHEAERKAIAENGYRKVKEQFGYEDRIITMLRTAGLLV